MTLFVSLVNFERYWKRLAIIKICFPILKSCSIVIYPKSENNKQLPASVYARLVGLEQDLLGMNKFPAGVISHTNAFLFLAKTWNIFVVSSKKKLQATVKLEQLVKCKV